MVSVFLSYSHCDEDLRKELETHLALLRRQGIIDVWHDRRIGPGDELHGEISSHLETADIILLLISANFLASDYCHDVEMKRALDRHENGARVIPVILRPCDWHSASFGGLNAVPKDGKPVVKHATLDDGFLEVAQAVRQAASTEPGGLASNTVIRRDLVQGSQFSESSVRSSNLRIRRRFTDHDRHQFLNQTFEFIARYFENTLNEMRIRNAGVEANFLRVDSKKMEATVFIGGQEKAWCQVSLGGTWSTNQIFYSAVRIGNGYNESMSIGDDGYTQFVTPMGMPMFGELRDKKLTQEGAAEYLWSLFIERLR
jgi:hypothetical protein